MGVGGEKKPMHEIAETRAAGRIDLFDEILEKVKSNGGKIESDETSPLFIEVGMQDFEIGQKRVAIFTVAGNEFELSQRIEEETLQGQGHQKHVEKLETPRITETLKRKNEHDQWEVMDLEALS